MKPKHAVFICGLIIAAFVALTGITGCMSTAGEKNYYQLYLPAGTGAGAEPPAPRIHRVLLVERVDVEDVYNDYRLVYRSSPYQLNYYAYHLWIKKPGKIVRDAITGYLENGKYFKRIVRDFSEGTPDWMLNAAVHTMEEYDHPGDWYARLKMDIEIKEFKSGKQVLFYTFNRQIPMPGKNVGHLPILLSRILKEELDNVLTRLEEKTSKQ